MITIAIFLRGCQPSPPIQPQAITYRYYFPMVTNRFNPKRGVVNVSNCADVKTVGAAWTYGYSPIAGNCPNVDNVPMIRDLAQVEWLRNGGKVRGDSDYILGFNEPDGGCVYGSCLSPQDAVPLWREIEGWYPDKLLVAPSPSSRWIFDEWQWLTRFRNEYHARYGTFPRFDALAVHIYFVNANQAKDVIHQAEALAEQWSVDEIWVTEFGTPWSCNGNEAEIQNAVAFLNADQIVTHYSWFGSAFNLPSPWYPPVWCDLSLVDADGKLTEFGKAYR